MHGLKNKKSRFSCLLHSVSEAATLTMSQDYHFSQDAESQLAANEGKFTLREPWRSRLSAAHDSSLLCCCALSISKSLEGASKALRYFETSVNIHHS